MKVLLLSGDQDYWSIFYEDISYGAIKDKWNLAMNGKAVSKEWKKVEVKIVFRGEKSRIKPDFMDFGGLVGIA